MSNLFKIVLPAMALLAIPTAVLAQRTDENAVTAAEDAFGTTVGRESIGIYNDGNVRGFSPSTAGNFRIEGLYFDNQGGVTSTVNDGQTIHVGPSAQGFAFPAPTGVVDLSLRSSDQNGITSPLFSTSSFGGLGLEVDTQTAFPNGLSAALGVGYFEDVYGDGGSSTRWSIGVVPQWRLSEKIELKAFYSHEQTLDDTSQAIYIPQGNFLPNNIVRARYPGPNFLLNDYYNQAFGVLGRVRTGAWTFKGGIFRSMSIGDVGYSSIIRVASNGQSTQRFVDAFPPNAYASWSGEFRTLREFSEGQRKHLITFSIRGRSKTDRYGDGIETDLGSADLNATVQAQRPNYVFGPTTDDMTDQLTGGLAYNLNWERVGEITIGMQRTHYNKRVEFPDLASVRGVTMAWLPSVSAAVPLGRNFALYGSYVRGLEDAGTAPGFASNANSVLPANRTTQFDMGVKVKLPSKTTLIFGYYDVEKPYIDLNTSNLYSFLGKQRHPGFELSVTSTPIKGVTIVGGGVFSRPRVSATSAIAEPIGARPIGQPDTQAQLNVNYDLPFAPGVTLDAYIDYQSRSAATVDNRVTIPSSTSFGGGLRYNFEIEDKSFTLRVSVYNLGNTYRLIPIGSGVYTYNNPMNATIYLAADF